MLFHVVNTRKKLLSLTLCLIASAMSCKTTRKQSAVETVKLSPDYPGLPQAVWMTKDEKVHLGNCRNCPESKDAAPTIPRSDYAIKIRNAALSMRPAPKDGRAVPGLKEVQQKLEQMSVQLKASGPNALNSEERKAFEAEIIVLEKVLALTEEEKKLVKKILDYLETEEELPLNQGERRYDLALAPFGNNVSTTESWITEINCRRNALGMEFCEIPKGTFLMGASEEDPNATEFEKPSHLVTTGGFEMMATEVTISIWKDICANKCKAETYAYNYYDPSQPAIQVSLLDIQDDFLPRLNDKLVRDGYTYRLPTEEEWEYAARGGQTGPYGVTGNIKEFAWFIENASGLRYPVGRLKPNGYGLFDMHGNVMEWVSNSLYSYGPEREEFVRKLGEKRILRGGSYLRSAAVIRSSNRYLTSITTRNSETGFRLVRVKKTAN